MQYTRLSKRTREPSGTDRVYASLDELVRLQFKASGFSFLPRQPVHSVLSGRHASRLRGRGLNFEELRNYLPGDDIRSIDWKVTARTRKPHVRVYTEERDRATWLLVDQRSSMFFGSRWKMKSVVSAEAAAVSAWRVLSAGDRVGAVVFDDHGMDVVEPHRSRERVMHILRKVVDRNHALRADAPQPPGAAMFNRALDRICQLTRHDCLVNLISDGFGADEETTRLVTNLSRHNDVLSVFVYDPMERELPDAGRLAFSGTQGQLEVDTGSRRLRHDFASSFDQRVHWLKSVSRRYAIPMLTISTAEDALQQVKHQLGHHTPLRRR